MKPEFNLKLILVTAMPKEAFMKLLIEHNINNLC